MFDLNDYIVHDLTHILDNKIAGYSEKPARLLSVDGWNAKTLTIYSHAGTHVDAPLHFGVSNKSIDHFDLQELMGKAWIVDVSITKAKQLITLDDVLNQLQEFVPGDSLIIRSNWSKKYDQPEFKSNLPRISEELAQWCVNNKVKLLGVEPLSVADVENLDEVTHIHRILLGGDVVIIEGLTNLEAIKSKYVNLLALPLKIRNGDGAPGRVIAFEKK